MRLYVEAELRKIRAGIEAQAKSTGFIGHGLDEEEALESLRRVIYAWCTGLRNVGRLDAALKRRGLKVDLRGEEDIVVEVLNT